MTFGSRACLSFGHEEAQNFKTSIKLTHLVAQFYEKSRKTKEKPKRRLFRIQNHDHEKWITSNLFCNPRSEVDPEYLMRFQALEDFRGFVRITSLWLLIAELVIMCLQNYKPKRNKILAATKNQAYHEYQKFNKVCEFYTARKNSSKVLLRDDVVVAIACLPSKIRPRKQSSGSWPPSRALARSLVPKLQNEKQCVTRKNLGKKVWKLQQHSTLANHKVLVIFSTKRKTSLLTRVKTKELEFL